LYRLAKNAVMKAGQHAYGHRRQKKREFRQLWILRISAALRKHDVLYSRFFHKMAEKKVVINRKMLADIAVKEPDVFGDVVTFVMGK
jgi:large subunit ribosomal protein L20